MLKLPVSPDDVRNLFTDKIVEYLNSTNEKRKVSVHVTSLVYGCIRRSLFELRRGSFAISKETEGDGVFRIWMGTKLHETPITDKHETELELDCGEFKITGTYDEMVEMNGEKYILDKKFVGYTPKSMYPHHRTQVAFYATLLKRLKNVVVNGVILLYYNLTAKNGERVTPYIQQLTDADYDYYDKRLDSYIMKLKEHFNDEMPPNIYSDDNREDWVCAYCPFFEICRNEYNETHESMESRML